MEPEGFRTLLASSGEEALDIVRDIGVHLVLLDMHMPTLTGLETLQLARQINALLPAILMTGDSSQSLMRQALQAHVYTVIPKPVAKNVVLYTVVRRWNIATASTAAGRRRTKRFPPKEHLGMKVVPLNDKIVVKRLEADEKTAGGILLPDTAKEKPRQGKVVSLGEGKRLENGKRAAFQVREGDRVLFTSYAGNEVTVGADELLIMTEDDILAVVE